jgi:membrane protein
MNRLKPWIIKIMHLPVVRLFIAWARTHSLPGFRKIPVYFVARSFTYAVVKENPMDRAAAMTFKFFMALFPAILFLCTLIPLVPIEGFQDGLLKSYEALMPPQVHDLLSQTVEQVVKTGHTGLMSVSFLVAFFFSTNGIVGMIKAMNESANITEPGGKMRLKALAILLFVLSLSIVSMVAIILMGSLLSNFLMTTGWSINAAQFIYFMRLLILYAVVLLNISLIYYLAPAKKFRLGFFSPGAFAACNLSIISSVVLAAFFSNFDNYNTLYGTLGSIPIFMIWIYVNCLMLLAGFELNMGIAAGTLTKEITRRKSKPL